jgi:hypothetical protein
MKNCTFQLILDFLFVISLFNSCVKDSPSPSRAMAQASICIYVDSSVTAYHKVAVYIDGNIEGYLTTFFSNQPDCVEDGTLNIALIPGNHQVSAKSDTSTSGYYVLWDPVTVSITTLCHSHCLTLRQ